jgi:phosphatidylglycerophosphate synthase
MKRPIHSVTEILDAIAQGRQRTNLLRKYEQRLIAFLVRFIPLWVSSNMLTAVGFLGNVLVFLSFVLAAKINGYWLFLGIAGFAISWFGDSLDGRIAYYRNKPRKWFGFALDIAVDWLGIVLIGLGFILYANGYLKIVGYAFITFYGLEIIIALMKYKITGNYSIDAGLLGPTEARIVISLFLLIEIIFRGTLQYMALAAVAVLVISSFSELKKLLDAADAQDREEKRIRDSESKNIVELKSAAKR